MKFSRVNDVLRNDFARVCILVCVFALLLCSVGSETLNAQTSARRNARKGSFSSQRHQTRSRGKSGRTAKRDLLQPSPQRAEDDREDDARGRASWFLSKRAYPFETIPDGARRRAWDSLPARSKAAVATSNATPTWTPIGPAATQTDYWGGTTSGRINAVAVSSANTQIVLVGASTGGIWRSVDGGAHFVPVSDEQIDMAVSWITFAPSNPAIVYAGMGDIDHSYLGSGILKSINGGQTWMRVSNSSLPEGVTARLEVDPGNPNRVYLAQKVTTDRATNLSRGAGFFISTDGGVNWTRTFIGQACDLVIHPTNPQTLYLTLAHHAAALRPEDNLPGLYRSTDGGNTWTNLLLPTNGLHADIWDMRVAVTPADPQRVYAYYGSIFSGETRLMVSSDGGTTWQNRSLTSVDSGQFGYCTYIFADPANADIVYIGSRDLFKSTNGGVNWTNLTHNFSGSGTNWTYQPSLASIHADQQNLAFQPGNSSVLYIANDGGLWKSTDGGANPQSLNATLSLVQFNSLALHPSDAGMTIGGTQDNGSQIRLRDTTTNAPTEKWDEFSGSDGGACLFNLANPDVFYATYYSAWVLRFRFSGSNILLDKVIGYDTIWGESNLNTRIGFYPPFTGNGVDQKIYFGTWRLFVSDNLGDTWTPTAGTFDLTKGGHDVLSAIGVARSDLNVIYTGSAQGRAMVSSDGGATWTNSSAGLPNRFIEKIVVDPANPSVAYLAVSGFGSGHVFKTVDRGTSWTDASANLPNVPVNALLVDPLNSEVIYAGTDIGVFRRTTATGPWEFFNEGLPRLPVTAFEAQANGRIQVATFGRGAFELVTSAAGPSTVAFSTTATGASETAGSVSLTVTRTGDSTTPAQVTYATANGTASDRSDYSAANGTLSFAPGETSKSIEVFLANDVFSEPAESFSVTLSNPVNMSLGAQASSTITIASDDLVNGQNPMRWNANFDSTFFVQQHYVDFFNREPDAAGLAFWKNQIDECETRPEAERENCREVRRINVSAAFFLSIEFQETGYLVYRTHQAAFNTAERLQLRNFLADTREIGKGIIVGPGDWQSQLEVNKATFFANFVKRADFGAQYQGMTNAEYVDALNANTGGSLTQNERNSLVDGLNAATETRATVLRRVVENGEFSRRHFNRAFVLMQYFGYLRRNPNESPEANLDFAGFNFWLSKLDQFGGNFVNAEMVKAFITSGEYQLRFGP